jgi:hypothetical protein
MWKMLSTYNQCSSLGEKVGSTQETKQIKLSPLLVSPVKERCSYCLSIHTVMKESTEFYKRRCHLSDSGICTRIVLRYKEIGHAVCELDSTASG